MGEQLARVLNDKIDEMVTDDLSRSDIVQRMGSAAGIESGTVNQILEGSSINCPPPRRLRAFARTLSLAVSSLFAAGNRDGCDYDEANSLSRQIERRFHTAEIRLEEVDGQRRIVGYAGVFNQLSEDFGGFREIIEPGAFSSALERGDDVRALINHDVNMILGRTSNSTLNLKQDDHGLRYEIIPPDTSYARDLLTSLDRGDIDQSSFGFRVSIDGDRWDMINGRTIRTLIDFKRLYDISPVTFPAYPVTSAEARAMAVELKQQTAGGGASSAATTGDEAARRLAFKRRRLDLLEL